MNRKTPSRFWLVAASVCAAVIIGGADRASVAAKSLPSFDTSFVTRAEAVMFLLQARVPKIPNLATNGEFPDVARGAWYDRYIAVGERLGIIQANAVTHTMRPDDPVTRAEFLRMAAKTFGVNIALFTPTYRDVPANAWYAGEAGMAERLNLFPGDPDRSLLRPEDNMIHTEVAKAVQILTDTTASAETAEDAQEAKMQSALKMEIYKKISSKLQQVTLVKTAGTNASESTRSSKKNILVLREAPAGSDVSKIPALRAEILRLVNDVRKQRGIAPLAMNSTLERSAQEYAEEMAIEGFFGHVSPAGETLKMRMERSGYYKPFFQSDCMCIERYLMGENIARGQRTPAQAVEDWLRSPTHRAAVLSVDFTDTGIGIKAGIWVQHFGGKQK